MERPFSRALRAAQEAGKLPVIADLKARSPQEGDLFRGRTAPALARALLDAGAPALSVVTEGPHYGGSLATLAQVAALGAPVLRKDFLHTREDLAATKAAGAAAVLLICAMHTPEDVTALFHEAHAQGLEVLLETASPAEMALACALDARLVGINNRDITRWELDDGTVSRTESLARLAPPHALLISESAIATPADARRALAAGAHGVLVGTALLTAPDITATYRALSTLEEPL